jgi:hypothetical protein
MTDIEIMIALECHDGDVERCLRCPYRTSDDCYVKLSNDALDLIKRQKAKIEGLTYNLGIRQKNKKTAKSEAIKEFADRFKKDFKKSFYCNSRYVVVQINNLVKEMTEGEK